MKFSVACRGRGLRPLLVLICATVLAASEARIERVLQDFDSGMSAAAAEREQAVARARERLQQAVDEQRARATRDLQRLLRGSSVVTDQVLIHRALLRVDPAHAPSRDFFTTLGTLDHELKALETFITELTPAASEAVDILATARPLPHSELSRNAVWLARLRPEDLQAGALRDYSPHARHASLQGELPMTGPTFTNQFGLRIPAPGLTLGPAWAIAVVGTFPVAGDQAWRTLAANGWGQHHIAVDAKGRPGVFHEAWIPADGGDLRQLTGRHCLVAVGEVGRTAFFLDGELLGTSPGQVTAPLLLIGNHLSLDQPWCMPVETIAVYDRAFDQASVAALSAQLLQ